MPHPTTVLAPTVEHLPHGFAVPTGSPRLSWKVETTNPAWAPGAYEIELAREGTLRQVVVVQSEDQVLVPWPFEALRSRERVSVRVRVHSTAGDVSPYSPPTDIEVSLLDAEEWTSDFIAAPLGGPHSEGSTQCEPSPILYRDFEIVADINQARVYVSALGLYSLSINGQRVGEDLLTPGWTAYESRLRFQTYDVGSMLVRGVNRIEANLGNGWYRGQLVSPGNRNLYGDRLALRLQLEMLDGQGRVQTVSTDSGWRSRASGVVFNDIYDGETRDLTVDNAALEARSRSVDLLAYSGEMVGPDGPAVRVTERRSVAEVIVSPSGKRILDFGQNVVGFVRIARAAGAAGQIVTVRHAEVLENGELGTRPLRSAKATCTYVLSGGTDILEPTFTFHGFRYADIDGLEFDPANVEAVVIGSDLQRTGWLETSDPEVNKLLENIVWSARGNFLDVPMDCPQRDERLGWTGDIQVFAPAAATLFKSTGFLSSWLRDLSLEQFPDGGMPYVVPDVLRGMIPGDAAAGWGDAATLVPWAVYESSGDLDLLRRQYPSMRSWVDKVARVAGPSRLWGQGYQFGDWLDPGAPPNDAGRAKADPDVVATAYFFRSVSVLADAAALLGHARDSDYYSILRDQVREAFVDEYVSADGIVRSDCQTVYALALAWDIVMDPVVSARMGERLNDLVVAADFSVSTGFLGTPAILEALTRSGYSDSAVRMLLMRQKPSWLYAVSMGATTVWERWDSMMPDGSINPGDMTSFNHFAYGAIADWMFRRLAGITPLSAGYREVEIAPIATTMFRSIRGHIDTVYGRVSSDWRVSGATHTLTVELPPGVTGLVRLADGTTHQVAHGTHQFVRETNVESRSHG